MSNLDKIAILKQENTPYYKPISDTQIGFYNTDTNTAKLRFIVHRNGFPYQLGPVNVVGYLWLKSSNGSMSGQLDLSIYDAHGGIVEVTVPNEFLKAATDTNVEGQILLAVNGNTDIATLGKFGFYVADALPNQVKGEVKVQYFRMFDDLKYALEQQVADIRNEIESFGDYVVRVQDASASGIQQIQSVKDEVTSTINNVSSNATRELTNLLNQYKQDIDETKGNAVFNIQSKIDEASQVLDDKKNESVSYIDSKIEQFNNNYNNYNFASISDVDNKLSSLQWQKNKLTSDDGSVLYNGNVDFNNPDETLTTSGTYYVVSTNQPDGANRYGFATMMKRSGSTAKLIYMPYNSNDIYMKLKPANSIWSDWKKTSMTFSDTGWIEFFLINGANSNTAFSELADGGFKCAYRKVVNETLSTNYLRLNGTNLTHGQVLVNLPKGFVKNAQSFPVRVPTSESYTGGFVTIRPSGEVKFYVNGDKSQWNNSAYIYSEISWTD
ncbi:hypothetical protein DOS62_06710 [Staphylococcus felis]|uniref:BppU family phage baseplate upper protein n=1 Tax=Staphylococcus felis TaxID=46127 RepID=UPI000E22C5D1|nr:BppU family phage baseplate upper protein [Staphylococcus felis]REI04094.1 hypothetical protein DOS62_06710 [Staphylococcus felis]